MNIERGILWNQENAVNDGVQVNYTIGPLALSASLNDGLYSGHWNWVWGSATWTIDSADTLAIIGSGATSKLRKNTFATPVFLNNEQLYNVIYTHTSGPWTIEPYFQYTRVPALTGVQNGSGVATTAASTYGGALFVKYSFDSKFSLVGRAEYLALEGEQDHRGQSRVWPRKQSLVL
jgi:hypothetical protein